MMRICNNKPMCACGCGRHVARYNNRDGTFNRWRRYATGHAPRDEKDVRVPDDLAALGYAAGIIDGEGCIHASLWYSKRGVQKTVLRVDVAMCSTGSVTWLHQQFGGRMYRYRAYSKGRREKVIWQLTGTKVCLFLTAILPYLQDKREQAEVALEFAATFGSSGQRISEATKAKREWCHLRLKALKESTMLPKSSIQ